MSPMTRLPLLRRPAARDAGPRHLVDRPPAFIGCRPRLLDRPAHAAELAHEIVELGIDLAADAAALFGEVQPSPHTPGDRAEHGGCQYTGSIVHLSLLEHIPDVSKDVPQGRREDRKTEDGKKTGKLYGSAS